jgi:hypothetical protein
MTVHYFAHGARFSRRPICQPEFCSVDPTTGNLAAVGYPELGGAWGGDLQKGADPIRG